MTFSMVVTGAGMSHVARKAAVPTTRAMTTNSTSLDIFLMGDCVSSNTFTPNMSPGSTQPAFDARVPEARARHAPPWGHFALFMLALC